MTRRRTGASRRAWLATTPGGWPSGRSGAAGGIRLWEVGIEVRTAATDRDNAWIRLANYLRHPYYRSSGAEALLSFTDTSTGTPADAVSTMLSSSSPTLMSDPAERFRLELA